MKTRGQVRIARRIIAVTTFAAISYGQPPSPDPHEDPAVQNSPIGKKVTPASRPSPAAAPKRTPSPNKPAPKRPPSTPVAQAAPLVLNAESAVLGTWVLVKEKSTFQPGPAPHSEVRTYSTTSTGIEATVTTINADGRSQTVRFPWRVDGSEYPVQGSELLDTIRLQRVDNLTAEATLRHGTKDLVKERRALAADGKTMTITVIDVTSEDRPVTVTAVYAKQ